MIRLRISLLAPLLLVLSPPLSAPIQAQEARPVIRVAGSGEVPLVPDFATFRIGVRVQDSTAEAAAAAMSSRIDAVVDTLEAMGFPQDSLPTRLFDVSADRAYREGNRIVGYSAGVTLEVRTFELDRLAEFVGRAITAGATEAGGVRFDSTERSAARAEAIRLALEAAQRDAEVIAEARGGRLGRLIEISTVSGGSGRTYVHATEFEMAGPPISGSVLTPDRIKVRASVEVLWELQRD
jgi:hypothetical protein